MPKTKSVKRKTAKKSSSKSESDKNIEKVLVENFVSLQKVMTDLSTRFDKLTNQISDLLEIFETSAEALSRKDFKQPQTSDPESHEKIISGLKELSDQNKIIAKGLTLVHEKDSPTQEIPDLDELEEEPIPDLIPSKPLKKIPAPDLDDYEETVASKLKKIKSWG